MKKKYFLMITLLILATIGSTLIIANTSVVAEKDIIDPEKGVNSEKPDPIIVYVTKSGKKYHRSNCSFLKSSKIPITLEQAVADGYTPCSRCNPPVLPSSNQKSSSELLSP